MTRRCPRVRAAALKPGEGEGSIDTSSWTRPEAKAMLDSLATFQARCKAQMLEVRWAGARGAHTVPGITVSAVL